MHNDCKRYKDLHALCAYVKQKAKETTDMNAMWLSFFSRLLFVRKSCANQFCYVHVAHLFNVRSKLMNHFGYDYIYAVNNHGQRDLKLRFYVHSKTRSNMHCIHSEYVY